MRKYLLSPNSFGCETGGQAIFLDLDSDRYTTLANEDVFALRAYVRGWERLAQPESRPLNQQPLPEDLSVIQKLLQENILTQDEMHGKEAKPVDIEPVDSTIDDVSKRFP